MAIFLPLLAKKQPKLTRNEENGQNQNCSMKISGIWNAVASQQNKMKKILYFFIWHFLAFIGQKQLKETKSEETCQDSNHLIKYSKILVCTYFQINENSYRTQSSILTILGQKTVKIYKK